ncbi:hypothetical protein BDZ45DRAFT_673824 [Acephala macrosclerotiorum]|nr:hypothetical protein BDZ45DRAFT_673824 [Acephala macrosclerotiorum]
MLFQDLVQPLNLTSTSYITPNDTSKAVIPGAATDSGWNINCGDFTTSVLPSPLPSLTTNASQSRRHLLLSKQPRTVGEINPFITAPPRRPHSLLTQTPLLHIRSLPFSIDTPWGIYRLQPSSPNASRIVDLYTKSGDISAYHSNLVLILIGMLDSWFLRLWETRRI